MKALDSIYTAVKPLFYLSKAFGLAPFSFVKDKESGTFKLKSHCFDMLWGVALFLCFLINLPLSLYLMLTSSWNQPIKLIVVGCLQIICSHLSGMISLLSLSISKRHIMPNILFLISEVDQLLYDKPKRLIVYKETRSFILWEFLIISVTYLPLCICYYYFFPKETLIRYFVLTVNIVLPILMLLLVIQFTNIVFLLRQRYKCLNRWLDHQSDIWKEKTKSGCKDIVFLSHLESYKLSRNMKYGKLKIFQQRHVYSKLHDIAVLVNSYFGLPVFMLTCWIFTCAVFVSYSCILNFTYGIHAGREFVELAWTVIGLVWCVVCICFLLLLTLSCHTTTEECSKSQVLVEKLMLHSGLSYETTNELRILSTQLNNMKVSFSAYGFFSLDLPFMYNFIGVICTYIVILAQFE
jgi:hypothetical protein